jgi:hypothetical protein
MKLGINDKGIIELDMLDIVREVVGNTPDEELDELISMFGFQKRISKMVSEALAEEFSRANYNTNIHECRDLFLKHIKQEEIKYYASVITDKLDDYKRAHEQYWKLYNWCSANHVFQGHDDYPSVLNSPPLDFDFRRALEADIVKAFAGKFPDVK